MQSLQCLPQGLIHDEHASNNSPRKCLEGILATCPYDFSWLLWIWKSRMPRSELFLAGWAPCPIYMHEPSHPTEEFWPFISADFPDQSLMPSATYFHSPFERRQGSWNLKQQIDVAVTSSGWRMRAFLILLTLRWGCINCPPQPFFSLWFLTIFRGFAQPPSSKAFLPTLCPLVNKSHVMTLNKNYII